MQHRSSPAPASTPANRFRAIIEAAIASGAEMSQQVLQLTHGDNARLRKDPAIRDDEIRFEDGGMSFLGVRVVVGSPVSALSELNGVIIPPNPAEGAITAMPKVKRRATRKCAASLTEAGGPN